MRRGGGRRGGWKRRNWRHARYRGERLAAAAQCASPDASGPTPDRDDARQLAADYAQARRLTDAASAAAAVAAQERAARLEAERIEREARREADERLRSLTALNRALDNLLEARAKGGAAVDNAEAQASLRSVNLWLDQLAFLRRQRAD